MRRPARDSGRRRPALTGAGAKYPRAIAERRPDGEPAEIERLRQALQTQSARVTALTEAVDELAAKQEQLHAEVSTLAGDLPRVEEVLRKSIDDLRDSPARDASSGDGASHRRMVRCVRELVGAAVPRESAIILVGKADQDLLNIPGRRVWRFPQAADGSYSGFYPACSTSAIAHLEALRSRGADFLLIPEMSRWWLDHYADFRRHVERLYRLVADDSDAGVLFALRLPPVMETTWQCLEEALAKFRREFGRDPAILDWNTGLALDRKLPRLPVFSPPTADATLPYLDRTVDMVIVASSDAATIKEAERVADSAVVTCSPSETPDGVAIAIQWKTAPAAAMPTVSIIIPCFNGVAHTEACLAALRQTLPDDFRGEIIVVDDASTDGTPACLERWRLVEKRLKIIRNRTNAGFLRSTNKGAKVASGEILVFLNNDTIPIAGWLPPLLRLLAYDPTAGAVGGRLVYPDGRLQEAGGLVFSDGSAANFGRDDQNPDAPLFSFVREVDYCSAALLATRAALFRELGGFDKAYGPGYYEDTDYCFRLRERGYRVLIQPETVVVHTEGGTAGLDVSQGMKRYQVVNQARFLKRWQHVLQDAPPRPGRLDFAALHNLAIRPAARGDRAE